MLTAFAGAIAGLVHVLAGPDHLAAVAPLAVDDRDRGWVAGSTWGLGHAAGVASVAALAMLLRDRLPPIDAIAAWSERLVGVALVGVGCWALGRSLRVRPAAHTHGGVRHDHVHVQRGPGWFRRLTHAHASFYLGLLHGVAGSSHVFGVLPALALPTRTAAFTYLAAYAAGTVAAMTGFAALAGAAGRRAHPGTPGYRWVMGATAIVAIAVGGVWLIAPAG